MNSWDSNTYSQFLTARTRPARDLLAAIPDTFAPQMVYDLGCGPGNSTILLKARWPKANIVGVDSSLNMLKSAKASYPDLTFIEGDIAHFAPSEKIDCLFANASLQWLENHQTLFPELIHTLTPGGILAVQMPNNFASPSHQVTIHLLQNHTKWKPLLKNLRYGALTQPLYQLPWYYDLLAKSGVENLLCWETEYLQEMSDHQAIFNWVKGTALRPILSHMDDQDKSEFAAAYIAAIQAEYPLQLNKKVLFPFKRIFIVGIIT